jgi:hypothetical protein
MQLAPLHLGKEASAKYLKGPAISVLQSKEVEVRDALFSGNFGGRGLHSFTLELNLNNSSTHS